MENNKNGSLLKCLLNILIVVPLYSFALLLMGQSPLLVLFTNNYTLVVIMALLFLAIMLYDNYRKYGFELGEPSFNKNLKIFMVGLAIYFLYMVASAIMQPALPSQENQEILDAVTKSHPGIMLLMITIMAPVSEEKIFRGVLVEGLSDLENAIRHRSNGKLDFTKRTPGELGYVSMILSTVGFALMHMPTGLGGWFLYLVPSMIFMLVRYKSKNIWNSTLLHMFINTFAYVINYL